MLPYIFVLEFKSTCVLQRSFFGGVQGFVWSGIWHIVICSYEYDITVIRCLILNFVLWSIVLNQTLKDSSE